MTGIRGVVFAVAVTKARILLIGLLGLFWACASGQHSTGPSFGPSLAPPLRDASLRLSETYARFRAEKVSALTYDLSFKLDANLPEFYGREVIGFQYQGHPEPLTVDFASGKDSQIELNATTVDVHAYNGFFISLPALLLKDGANELHVEFRHAYDSDRSEERRVGKECR